MKKVFKGFLIGFGALMLMGILLVACSGVDSTETSVTKGEKPSEEQAVVANIGDELKIGDVVFKVVGTSTAKNAGGEYGVNSQGTFLILDVEVRNEGSEAILTDSSFFQLKADGKTLESSGEASSYLNENVSFFDVESNPDLTLKGQIAFDVSDAVLNAPEQILQVQTGMFGTESGEIKIK